MSRRVAILGSTGSIGKQTLEVIRSFPDSFDVVGLSTHGSLDEIHAQVDEFSPEEVAVTDDTVPAEDVPSDWLRGEEALETIAGMDLDILVLSVVGAAGLKPCLRALENDATVALANKEVLVVAGQLVKQAEAESDGRIIPVDSEHSALFQAARGESQTDIKSVTITASGGPFRTWSAEEIRNVSREEALDHPNWDMGPKITIDSATMMNKGLEVIEACHLLDLEPNQVNAIVHPQSTVHGFVEFADHSLVAHCAVPDMKLPIQYALFYPERREPVVDSIPMDRAFSWDFEPVDEEKFPAFAHAREALEAGGSYPAVLNAANEVAVSAFLEEHISFADIPALVDRALSAHDVDGVSLESLLEADRWARDFTQNQIEKTVTA
jgi:1-deoxy-D-xylulose-5-phosphate reductoisomerase